MTQKIALETLGFGPCYHMTTVLADPGRIPGWLDALEGRPDWEAVFAGFSSTVDYPGSFYYRELADAYPDAKVLLSVRDGHAWARSMRDTIWGVMYGDTISHHLGQAQAKIDPGMRQYTELMHGMFSRAGLFGPDPETFDEEIVAAAMERHNAEVRAAVPAGRLLEWSPADGWEPLCAFLGADVPEAALPRANDSAAFNEFNIGRALRTLNDWHAGQRVTA
jgi:hypothetical protein